MLFPEVSPQFRLYPLGQKIDLKRFKNQPRQISCFSFSLLLSSFSSPYLTLLYFSLFLFSLSLSFVLSFSFQFFSLSHSFFSISHFLSLSPFSLYLFFSIHFLLSMSVSLSLHHTSTNNLSAAYILCFPGLVYQARNVSVPEKEIDSRQIIQFESTQS